MSNYPPGVTGMEYEIAGPDRLREEMRYCPTCNTKTEGMRQGYRSSAWWDCDACDTRVDLYEDWEPSEEDDDYE